MKFQSLLGLNLIHPNLKSNSEFYYLINAFRSLSQTLLYISMILFLIDNLNPQQLGIVWGVHFATLALVDYPTGVLGDVIGYKQVLLLAYSFKIMAILILISWHAYPGILLFMIFYGLGISQESGALESWFDNAYKLLEVDTDRSNYTNFMARMTMFTNIFAVIGFISGGFITTLVSFDFLFVIYLFTLIFIISVIFMRMENTEIASKSSYGDQIKNTLKFFVIDKTIFYYFIGTAILWASNGSIWHTFLSIRLYREYSGSVAGAGIIRSILYVTVILYSALVVKFIRKFTATNLWIFISSMMSNSVFFLSVLLYFLFFPPTNSFNLFLIIGFLSLYQIPMFLESIEFILRSRLSIDLIPDQYRNSMYSLLPSIAQFFGSIFVIITGVIVAQTDLSGSFIWLIFVSFIGSLLLGIGLYSNHKGGT